MVRNFVDDAKLTIAAFPVFSKLLHAMPLMYSRVPSLRPFVRLQFAEKLVQRLSLWRGHMVFEKVGRMHQEVYIDLVEILAPEQWNFAGMSIYCHLGIQESIHGIGRTERKIKLEIKEDQL